MLWDVSRATGRSRAERVITEHTRAVNRLSFQPENGNILLSASQDGSMKCWVSQREGHLKKDSAETRLDRICATRETGLDIGLRGSQSQFVMSSLIPLSIMNLRLLLKLVLSR